MKRGRSLGAWLVLAVVLPAETSVAAETSVGVETFAASTGPHCDGDRLVVPSPAGAPSLLVPLPGPCLQVATDGDRSAVAAGALGAFWVLHRADQTPSVLVLPTVGRVLRVEIDAGVLVLHEEFATQRRLTLPDDGAPASSTATLLPPEGEIAPATALAVAPEPPVVSPAPRRDLGEVVRVQGSLVVVRAADPELRPGDLVSVETPAVAAQVLTDRGTPRLRSGRRLRRSVIAVEDIAGEYVVLRLSRGDHARVGDRVVAEAGLRRDPAWLFGPRPFRHQLSVLGELSSGTSVSAQRGVNALGKLRLSWATPIPLRLEAGVEALPIGIERGASLYAGVAVQGLAEVDLAPFGIGFGAGYQDITLEYRGGFITGLVRGGFRDGLHLELRARLLFGSGRALGSVEGRGVIPFNDLVGLSLDGGGGSQLGWARLGLQIYVRGQGGPGTVILNPSLGMQTVGWYGLTEAEDPWSGLYFWHIGPAFALRVEVRPR